MRSIILSTVIAALSLSTHAQSNSGHQQADTIRVRPLEPTYMRGAKEASAAEKAYARQLAEEREHQEQIDNTLPPVDTNAQPLTAAGYGCLFPYYGLGWNVWRLHEGLNVNVSASVSAHFGDGWGHGAGFGQDLSLMYVSPLSKQATLAIGGYLDNLTYSGDNYTAAGVNVLFGYRFNDHWTAYAFAQKAFVSDNYSTLYSYYTPWGYGYYPSGIAEWSCPWSFGGANPSRYMDRIGGGVTYHWGRNLQNTLNIQVEFDHVPSPSGTPYNHRRYDYPVR